MATLITNNNELRNFIPNSIREVKGEIPLFDKLAPFLDMAEKWVCRNFVPAELLDAVAPDAAHFIAVEAYRLAVPQLDIVLTPNGFATVGTQNLSPASKARVDRLVDGLLAERDHALALLLKALPSVKGWPESAIGRWFSATLFPNFEIVTMQAGEANDLWNKYCELRPIIIDLEASLAEEWFSAPLMDALRVENLRETLSYFRRGVVAQIQAQIVAYLRSGSFNSRRLADIVNKIRLNESEFQEWHDSDTAKLFAPPIFKNKKNAAGYFF